MIFLKETHEVTEIIKKYLNSGGMTGKKFAQSLGKDPAYLSRLINNKSAMTVGLMLKLFKYMGYEVVVMTKKEKNLLEKAAYAELAKEMSGLKKEVREGLINELEHDLMKNMSKFFKEKLEDPRGDR